LGTATKPPVRSLRPYQREAIAALAEGFKKWQRLVLCLPTGTGKTFTAAAFIYEHVIKAGKRAMWIAHSRELLDQACETFLSLGMTEEEIGRRYAHFKNDVKAKPDARLWVINNLIRTNPCESVDCIIFDEAHHADGSTYKRWMYTFGAGEEGGPIVLGLTATPYRRHAGAILPLTSDAFSFCSRPRLPVFQMIAYERSFAQLAAEGYLAPFKHISIDTHMGFQLEWDNRLKDFRQASLGQLDTPERNDFIFDLWSRNRAKLGKTLVFVGTQNHAERLAKRFGKHGGYMVSSMKHEERAEIMKEYKEGDLQVLVNVGIFKEGVDVPNIRTVILARPTASPMLFTQMVGRGARLCPATGKRFFYLVDIHDQLGVYDGYLMGITDLGEGDESLGEFIEARAEEAEAAEIMQGGMELPGQFLWGEGETGRGARRTKPRADEEDAPVVSLTAREINDYCGWICFEDGRGIPTKIAMFLTRGELDVLERAADSDGLIGPDEAEPLSHEPDLTATVRRCVSALARGLRGKVSRFPEDPAAAEKLVSEIRDITEMSVNVENTRTLDMPEFKNKIEAKVLELGLPGSQAESMWQKFLDSPDSYGGVLPLVDESTQELLFVKPGAVDCLRRAVRTRLGGSYNFEQVLDWLDEAVRVEPGLIRHYRQIVRLIRGAMSFDDVCIVAA
jgi:superfamily II DNA or RNA helicase